MNKQMEGSSSSLFDRDLGPQDIRYINQYNVGLTRNCICSALYTNPTLSPQQGIEAIQNAIQIIIERVPALSTVFTKTPGSDQLMFAQLKTLPEVNLQIREGIDLDFTSASYCHWASKLLDEPFDLGDSTKPLWKCFLLRRRGKSSLRRVVFLWSHTIMDGMCGPLLHELLSEVLGDAEHPYRLSRPAPGHRLRMPPNLEAVWNVSPDRKLRLSIALRNYILRPLKQRLGLTPNIPWMIDPVPSNIKTLTLTGDELSLLKEQGKKHGATITDILHACGIWALTSAQAESSSQPLEGFKTIAHTMMTLCPGHPGTRGWPQGPAYTEATQQDKLPVETSAYHRLVC